MLTTCPECNLPVSDKAKTCPHCGFPLAKPTTVRKSSRKSHMRLPNGFGQITEIKKPLRNPYRARITTGKTETGQYISKTLGYYETYNDAYIALVKYNKSPYDLDTDMTVKELYDKWSTEYFKNIKDSSARTVRAAWAYCTGLHNMKVRDVRVGHIKDVMNTCESENTKNRIKSVFNLMLDYAVEHGICDKNYARDFKTDKVEAQTEHRAFSDAEIELLWQNISVPYVNYVLIQCYMGWRPQELCLLKRSDVDLDEMTIVGGMKTEAGTNRLVPIHPKIQPIVKKIYNMSEMLGSDYLCPNLDGGQMTYDMYNKRFHRTMSDLGVVDHRPHDPRKTFVTMANKKGVHEYCIKRLIGHAIDDITEKIYTERDLDWYRSELAKI